MLEDQNGDPFNYETIDRSTTKNGTGFKLAEINDDNMKSYNRRNLKNKL